MGVNEGIVVGNRVGVELGEVVGKQVGVIEGTEVGKDVGAVDGTDDGTAVGVDKPVNGCATIPFFSIGTQGREDVIPAPMGVT